MTTCGQCGTTLNDGAASCGNCGWRMPEEPSRMVEGSAETGPEGTARSSAAYPYPPSSAPAKKKSCLGCALGALALLLVLCIVAGSGFSLWYFKGGGAQLLKEKYEQAVHPKTAPAGEEASPPIEESPPSASSAANEAVPESEAPADAPSPPEESQAPELPEPEPPRIIVDRPALRAAKEKAEVAAHAFRQAVADAERAGAARSAEEEFAALRETERGIEKALSRADSPAAYEAVARSAKEGVNRALELQSRAEKAGQEGQGMRKSAPVAPEAPPPPQPPPVKHPKASFGLIFETPVDGKKLVLKMDGEKLLDQDFRAAGGSYRLARDFAVAPGKHHLRAAVHQPDGQVAAQEWDFDFQPGTVPVFKVVLEKSPRQMTMKRVQ